jgi:CheY-like chemotaxis protein
LGELRVESIVILVIEDDIEIQAIIDEALCEVGYEPALAASGEEAVTLRKGGQTPYRVLVTDINPKGRMDGWEVAKQARGIDPTFPITYMTGVAADQWPSHGVPNSVVGKQRCELFILHCLASSVAFFLKAQRPAMALPMLPLSHFLVDHSASQHLDECDGQDNADDHGQWPRLQGRMSLPKEARVTGHQTDGR